MRKTQIIHSILFRIAPASLAIGLVFTATQAYAYYGGHHGGGHHGYGYHGGHYGGYHGYGYHGGHHGGYHGYGYYGGHYGGYHRYGYYGGHHGGLVYGLLSVPSAVASSLFGYYSSPGYYGGAYGGDSTTPPAAAPSGNGASYNSGPGTIAGGGWARLAEGRYSQALSIFGTQAIGHPNEGRPKIGFALSAAAGGDLRRGVWAMRRALRIDPNSMHYMTIDQPLRLRVERLVTQYNDDAGRTVRNAEAAFMLASLHYLLGDMNSARTAVDQAMADGDRNASTSNLKRLIGVDLGGDTQRQRSTDGEPSANGTSRSANY